MTALINDQMAAHSRGDWPLGHGCALPPARRLGAGSSRPGISSPRLGDLHLGRAYLGLGSFSPIAGLSRALVRINPQSAHHVYQDPVEPSENHLSIAFRCSSSMTNHAARQFYDVQISIASGARSV